MPTYEYACRSCGDHVEVVQSFRDDPLETCGSCGGALRKVFSAAGIIFKGSGYYVTDTRSERAAPASGSSDGAKKDSGKDDAKSDSGSSEASADSKGGESAGESKGSASSDSGERKSA